MPAQRNQPGSRRAAAGQPRDGRSRDRKAAPPQPERDRQEAARHERGSAGRGSAGRGSAGRSQAGGYLDYMLALASERVRRDLSAAMARHGLSLEVWHILTLLQDGQGRAMGEVAEAALLSLPTATRTVDRMVAEALVYRAPDPADRRRVLVLISDKGRGLWRKVKRDADRHQKAMIARYGDDWVRELIDKLDDLATGA